MRKGVCPLFEHTGLSGLNLQEFLVAGICWPTGVPDAYALTGTQLFELMVSLKHNFLFVHVPKTAGNAIQGALHSYSEDEIVCIAPFQDGIERFEVRSQRFRLHKHSNLREYKQELGDELFSRLFKFSCVRNPWDRLASYFFSPHRGEVTWDREAFLAFVGQVSPISSYFSLADDDQAAAYDNMDFIIRFEQLEEDFRKVCDLINIPYKPLQVRNRSNRRPYWYYYDQKLIELVRNKFAAEIEHFGYEFNSEEHGRRKN